MVSFEKRKTCREKLSHGTLVLFFFLCTTMPPTWTVFIEIHQPGASTVTFLEMIL